MVAEKLFYGVAVMVMVLLTCFDFKRAYDKEELHPLLHIISAIFDLVVLAVALLGLGGHFKGA